MVLVINFNLHDFWNVYPDVDTAHETQNFIKNLGVVALFCSLKAVHIDNPVEKLFKMKYKIQWQDKWGKWQHYQTKTNETDAFRVMRQMVKQKQIRHRIVDENGRLIDLLGLNYLEIFFSDYSHPFSVCHTSF